MAAQKIAFILLLTSLNCFGQTITEEHLYITTAIANYSDALERCNKIKSNRSRIDNKTLKILSNYEFSQVEVFLLTRSAMLEEQCVKQPLAELALAIHTLEPIELHSQTQKIIDEIKILVFNDYRWTMRKKYQRLPAEMRNALEKCSYFKQPFDSHLIRNQLEQTITKS